jgi:lipoprotein-anchoring transpeptidase ErfK/SrfK
MRINKMGNYYKRLTRVERQFSQSDTDLAKRHNILISERVTKMVTGNVIWIEVSLDEQVLYLYEGSEIISAYHVSTGRPGNERLKSMATRKGVYRMYSLYKSYPMWGRDWWCPDVPYAMFFHREFAIHGAYWHNNFGSPISHGCVNMTEVDAAEVFAQVKKGTVVWVH